MKDTNKKHPKRSTLGKNKTITITLFAVVLIVIDQFLKKYFTTHSYYSNLISFHLVKNTGASFGFLQGRTIIMIIISFFFLGLLWKFKDEFKECNLCLLFLIAGTIGNLIDRLFLGYVIDFVDLGWFPVFNLADVLISVGTLGLILLFIKELRKTKINKTNKNTKKKNTKLNKKK
ncbi:MAG: signal peptidase II [Candidatus Nanoarchaeia archaeon]